MIGLFNENKLPPFFFFFLFFFLISAAGMRCRNSSF